MSGCPCCRSRTLAVLRIVLLMLAVIGLAGICPMASASSSRSDDRSLLIEGIGAHLRQLGGEARRARLVEQVLDQMLPPNDDIQVDVQGDLLPRLRRVMKPFDRSAPYESQLLWLHWRSAKGIEIGCDEISLKPLLEGKGHLSDGPDRDPGDAELIHFCTMVSTAARQPSLDAQEQECVQSVLDQTLEQLRGMVVEALLQTGMPKEERAYRLSRMDETLEELASLIEPYLGTALFPELRSCRDSLERWKDELERNKKRYMDAYLDSLIPDIQESCLGSDKRWSMECLIESRRRNESLSGLLGHPNSTQYIFIVGKLLALALQSDLSEVDLEQRMRALDLARAEGARARALREATELATEGTLDGEDLNRDRPFNNLGQALIYGGVRIIDGLIDIPDAVGTPRR